MRRRWDGGEGGKRREVEVEGRRRGGNKSPGQAHRRHSPAAALPGAPARVQTSQRQMLALPAPSTGPRFPLVATSVPEDQEIQVESDTFRGCSAQGSQWTEQNLGWRRPSPQTRSTRDGERGPEEAVGPRAHLRDANSRGECEEGRGSAPGTQNPPAP